MKVIKIQSLTKELQVIFKKGYIMTLFEILQAMDEGKKVFWKSDDYPVVYTSYGIMIHSNAAYSSGCNLPLSFAYGTKDFEAETFYIKEVSC